MYEDEKAYEKVEEKMRVDSCKIVEMRWFFFSSSRLDDDSRLVLCSFQLQLETPVHLFLPFTCLFPSLFLQMVNGRWKWTRAWLELQQKHYNTLYIYIYIFFLPVFLDFSSPGQLRNHSLMTSVFFFFNLFPFLWLLTWLLLLEFLLSPFFLYKAHSY